MNAHRCISFALHFGWAGHEDRVWSVWEGWVGLGRQTNTFMCIGFFFSLSFPSGWHHHHLFFLFSCRTIPNLFFRLFLFTCPTQCHELVIRVHDGYEGFFLFLRHTPTPTSMDGRRGICIFSSLQFMYRVTSPPHHHLGSVCCIGRGKGGTQLARKKAKWEEGSAFSAGGCEILGEMVMHFDLDNCACMCWVT